MSVSNRRVSDLIRDIEEGRLEVRPFFQRRLVWTNTDKEYFIDTVLKNYPFPEIFIAAGALDRTTAQRINWLVDGQQRLTTLVAYFQNSDDILYRTIPRFRALSPDQQTGFLDYEVAVRDLGTFDRARIQEIFRRINSTDYGLKSMEILNAQYNGAFSKYCGSLSRHPFFESHNVFPPAAKKRMYDVTFCVILVTTVLSGYYRRDEKNAEYLERYNDEFPLQDDLQRGIDKVFAFIEDCRFEPKSRAWKQTDLFTLIVELYVEIVTKETRLAPNAVGVALRDFYARVDKLYDGGKSVDEGKLPADQQQVFRYLKAATKATNDKYARMERAAVIRDVIQSRQGTPTGARRRARRAT